jgi:glycosidase/fibronectin type 3 domain-containing protein
VPSASPNAILPSSSNQPTFVWGVSTDPDAGDTVIGYLLELGNSGTDLDGSIRHRVLVSGQTYSYPTTLTDSTYYTWRVRPIDRTGRLGGCTSITFFVEKQKEMIVSAPLDNQNRDNMNRINGAAVGGTTVRWDWAPAVHSYNYGIDSYVVEIDTAGTFTAVSQRETVAGSVRQILWSGAQRGQVYYARIRAIDTGGTLSEWSSASDGILVSRRGMDSDSSDWVPAGGYTQGTANLAGGPWHEGVWRDTANDHRTEVANHLSRDILSFHVTADSHFLYFLMTFAEFTSGACLGQIAVSYDNSSDNTYFQGRGVRAEDSQTTLNAAWERLVRFRTGNGDVTVYTPSWSSMSGQYSEHIGQKYVELAVPMEALGGADKILGNSVKFTVATFFNDNGSVGQHGTNTTNIVDMVTDVPGNTYTVLDQSDTIVKYHVKATFNGSGLVTSFAGDSFNSTKPILPNSNGAPLGANRDFIMYNVFVDRFVSGRSNNVPGDPFMSGGDLKGLMDSITYFNEFGITGLYTGPVLQFGGGVWGYNQSDLYRIEYSFGNPNGRWNGFDDWINLAKTCRYHNMKLIVDWVPGQIYDGRTPTNHPEILLGKRFGGNRVREDMMEARQFMVDHALFMGSLGVYGLRADNTKFYDPTDEPANGLPFYRYMRTAWDLVFPELYVFGEQPGGSADVGMYTRDGQRMQGQLDFELRNDAKDWAWGLGSGDFKTRFEAAENNYSGAVEAAMAGLIENHDHNRAYHYYGGGSDNDGSKNTDVVERMRLAFAFTAVHAQNPIIFYGDEIPLSGYRGWTYPYPGEGTDNMARFGNTRQMVFSDASSWWLKPQLQKWFRARNIFGPLRASRGFRSLHTVATAGAAALVYRRGDGGGDREKFIAVFNNDQSNPQNVAAPAGEADGQYFRDWMNAADQANVAGGNLTWTTAKRDGRLWIKGGYTRRTVRVEAGAPDVIVSLDNISAWTRKTNAAGYADIEDVVVQEGAGGNTKQLYAWRYGYRVLDSQVVVLGGGGNQGTQTVTLPALTLDNTPPDAPNGLVATARDRAVFLRWNPVTDDPVQDKHSIVSYYVYRSKTSGDANPTHIIETLQPWYYDSDLDAFLTNGDTYYYRVACVDRNGNVSAKTSEARVVPRKYRTRFYFTTEGTGWNPNDVTSVKIAGNAVLGLGAWSPIAMTRLDTSLWYYETELDPTSRPELKYTVNDQWEWDNIFFSNNISYERHGRPRLITILDHTGDGTAVFTHRWNTDGDVAPRRVTNALAVGAETGVYIGWTPNLEADVNRYVVERSSDGVSFSWLGDVVPTQNSFLDMTVTVATTYYYRVRAVDWWNSGGDWSATTSAATVIADVTPPVQPAAPTLNPVDTTTIRLSWTPNSEGDLAGYSVYRSTDPTVPLTLLNRVNASLVAPTFTPIYLDTGVTTGTRYYYRIAALDQAGNVSAGSETRSAMLVAATFNLDLAVVTSSSVEISGSAYSLGPSPARVTMTQVGATTWRKTVGLFAGEAISFRYSYNAGSQVEDAFPTSSQRREYTPPEQAAVTLEQDWNEAPRGVATSVAYPGNKTVYINWTADSSVDVIGYHIERASASDSVFRRLNTTEISGIVYTDSGLTNGETYYYRLRSVDGGVIRLLSSPSRVVSATPEEPVWVRFRVEQPTPPRRERYSERRRW